MTTGERIKEFRKKKGLSADELGALIGKDRSTIYRYERGDIDSATIDVIPPLAKALGTAPQHLLGWDDVPTFKWEDCDILSNRANQWFSWTKGYLWTDEEVEVFAAQARYLMRIKDSDEYDTLLQFLATFYKQLNK